MQNDIFEKTAALYLIYESPSESISVCDGYSALALDKALLIRTQALTLPADCVRLPLPPLECLPDLALGSMLDGKLQSKCGLIISFQYSSLSTVKNYCEKQYM